MIFAPSTCWLDARAHRERVTSFYRSYERGILRRRSVHAPDRAAVSATTLNCPTQINVATLTAPIVPMIARVQRNPHRSRMVRQESNITRGTENAARKTADRPIANRAE
jgi:hypothetical protein